MRYLRIKHIFFTSILILTFCSGKAQQLPFYKVSIFEEEGFFSKTVFPFNPAFIKAKKVKTIVLGNKENTGRDYHYSFDINGRLTCFTILQREDEKTDTAFYTTYRYIPSGNADYIASIDYHDGLVRVSKYAYNNEGKIKTIRNFTLDADMPGGAQKSNIMNYQTVPGTYATFINGTGPDEAFYESRIIANDFSSVHYRYYSENGFTAEEQIELFDFKKKYGTTDTCSGRQTYYYKDGVPVIYFLHSSCSKKKTPDKFYSYQKGLLTSIQENPSLSDARNERYSYDRHQNLILMNNEWGGEVVSSLIMTYTHSGFLKSIQRKSTSAKEAVYFEDRILVATYTFYP